MMVVISANRKSSYVPPSYKPGYPAAKYEDVPACAKNNPKPWCLSDPDYPIYDVQKALDQHYQQVLALYKDVKATTSNSVDDLFTQSTRIEECDVEVGSSCPLVSSCYESKCIQKNIFHRFLVFNPYDYYFPFAIENFELPASCGCVVGAFFP